MPKIVRRFYVVVVNLEGVPHYFEYEHMGTIDPYTKETLKKPMGYFCPDVKHARKFRDRWQAEVVSAGYEGSHIEVIKDGERLK